ncbi:hypothetical protein SB912_31275, partial [Pantoea sp. SIMBA_072]
MRATVVDAHHHTALVGRVGYQYASAERQAAMGGGKAVLVERFAAGGAFTVVARAVIGSGARLVVTARVDVVAGAA